MRVALLSPAEAGPARQLGRGLAQAGHRPWLITSHPRAPSTKLEDGLLVTRNRRCRERRLSRRGFEANLSHVPASYVSLTRGGNEFELAHAFHAPDALAALRWARKRGRPAAFSLGGVPDRAWLVARRLRLESVLKAVRSCDAVITESQFASDALARSIGVEARPIWPGVDLHRFKPARTRSPGPTILLPCPITGERERSLLLETLVHLRRASAELTLVLARPDDPALAAVFASHAGIVLTTRGACAYGRAWLTALGWEDRGSGAALLRSLACGTPVIGYARSSAAEVLDGDSQIGSLYPGLDPEAVAAEMITALGLIGQADTATACRSRAEQFSIERSVQSHEQLYLELLGWGS